MNQDSRETTDPSLELPDKPERAEYVLRLYVTGTTERSKRAVSTVKKICEERLRGRYELEVIDIYQQPQTARAEQVVAAPALVRRRPLPVRRLSGDLSDAARVLKLLDLQPEGHEPPAS
jgi:circadian clock protein KaiB